MNMSETIKTFLEKETGRVIEDTAKNLIETGILDSFSMFRLISFLETTFGIQIPMEELSPENFNSVATIGEFVQIQMRKNI